MKQWHIQLAGLAFGPFCLGCVQVPFLLQTIPLTFLAFTNQPGSSVFSHYHMHCLPCGAGVQPTSPTVEQR